jgi:type III secretory pathway component EscV
VPLLDLTSILEAFGAAGHHAHPDDIVEFARKSLRPVLRGATGEETLRTLGPDIENRIQGWTQTWNGKRFLALPDGEVESLRSAIRDRLGDDTRGPIVVLTPGLRIFVRRLVAVDYPIVPVLARSELADLRVPMPPRDAPGVARAVP